MRQTNASSTRRDFEGSRKASLRLCGWRVAMALGDVGEGQSVHFQQLVKRNTAKLVAGNKASWRQNMTFSEKQEIVTGEVIISIFDSIGA